MPDIIRISDYWKPHAKQREALDALKTYRALFYGGAGGGGKSSLIRWGLLIKLLSWSQQYNLRGIRVMIACEDYPTLRDRQLVKVEHEFPAEIGRYYVADREFKIHDAFGGGALCFRNLDDPSKYASSEWAAVAVDELTLNKDVKNLFLDLWTRLRWKGLPDEETFFLGTGNPVGPGLGAVKKWWIDRDFSDFDDRADEIAPHMHFIQAKVYDNPHRPKDYEKKLELLPPDRRRAMLDGSWTAFQGQYFEEWDEKVHVVEPFTIPQGTGRWMHALDWGYAAPFAYGQYWLSPDGYLYLVRELYRNRLRPSEVGKLIRDIMGDTVFGPIIADPSIFIKAAETQESIALSLGVPCIPANNERINGWMRVREWLRPFDYYPAASLDETGMPLPGASPRTVARLRIFNTCRNTIRTLPNMPRDEKNPEDIDTSAEDHCVDMLRYLCMGVPSPTQYDKAPVRDKEWDRKNMWRIIAGLPTEDEKEQENVSRSAGW